VANAISADVQQILVSVILGLKITTKNNGIFDSKEKP
jgi:hypothetical protein